MYGDWHQEQRQWYVEESGSDHPESLGIQHTHQKRIARTRSIQQDQQMGKVPDQKGKQNQHHRSTDVQLTNMLHRLPHSMDALDDLGHDEM